MSAYEQAASELTGCIRDPSASIGVPFCATHDEDGNPPWDRCRWVPIAAALAAAEQRGRDETARKVLRLAVMYDRLADHEDMHSAACDAFHDAALDIRRALADRSEAAT